MSNNNKIFLIFSLLMILVFAFVFIFTPKSNARTDLNDFTVCLKDSGAVFYGAFWCNFCQSQKQMFGTSKNLLPYQECSTADGNSQLPECTQKGIESYPTWVFSDGEKITGVVPLETLAQKTGCILPQENK